MRQIDDLLKQKPKPKDKFDAVKFLSGCANDKEAYSDKERSGFRKVIERIQELVRKQSMDSILRDVRWDSGKDYKVASARSERTYKADLDKREEDVARAEEDAAKYVEKIRESDGRVIFTP